MAVHRVPQPTTRPERPAVVSEAQQAGAPRGYRAAKRALDLVITVPLLVLVAPIWALIALWIRLDSHGPVLFRQTRIGQSGRPFTCFKFRTMYTDNDDRVHREYVAALIAHGRAAGEHNGRAVYKLDGDPRVTRAGRLLRKTSLDEVPQLLNVLLGTMSLVGPRPPLPYEVEQYQPWHHERLAGPPGITGHWQVYGRSRVTFDEMVRMDVTYLSRPSLRTDLKLIILTLPAVLFAGGGG